MPEENNRREHPDARRDEGKSCGVIQDLKISLILSGASSTKNYL